MLKRIGRAGAAAVMAVCVASAAFAQGGNALINGTVFDQAKAVLPGVTVTVTSPVLQVPSMTTVTSERGEYRITPLPIEIGRAHV